MSDLETHYHFKLDFQKWTNIQEGVLRVHTSCYFPNKANNAQVYVFIVVFRNKLLNKQSCCWDLRRRAIDVMSL